MFSRLSEMGARFRGLFLFIALLPMYLGLPALAVAQTPDENPAGAATALRTPPPELPPTQASVIREKMRVQIRQEGENKFRYARELHADGYLVRARQLLEDFLILFPDHQRRFAALEILARIEEEQDQPARAASAYRRAYASVPGEDRGLESALRAARLLAGMGQTDEAKALLLEIRARKPDSRLARLVEVELQSLGLPLLYERGQSNPGDAGTNNTTENADGVRQNPSEMEPGESRDGGSGQSTDRPNQNRRPVDDAGESSRGLLDGTDGVPTDDDRSTDLGRGNGQSRPNSAGDASADGQLDGAASGNGGVSNEALLRMGEGVERPRTSP